MSAAPAAWVCCHLGAREHYAVPRALHRRGRLAQLITDAWSGGRHGAVFGRLSQRCHDELAGAPVQPLTASLIAHELLWRFRRRTSWDLVIARNEWFQERAAGLLPRLPDERRPIAFAHSYAAGAVLRTAKQRGWMTVLGQIDPGPRHYQLQERVIASHVEYGPPPVSPPARYFDDWRSECEAADYIVVNSDWSRESLVDAGIDAAKITVIPLAYEPERGAGAQPRAYPDAFSPSRPMRVLFVGSASVMKGAADLLEAFASLDDPRIELRLAGHRAMAIPPRIARHARIHWIGAVDRSTVMEYYRASDVLVFPSHSDGFGMAQVEARAWRLPIVASRHCGRVVDAGRTGLVLDAVSPSSIAAALQQLVESPALLARFSAAMQREPAFGLDDLAGGLLSLERR